MFIIFTERDLNSDRFFRQTLLNSFKRVVERSPHPVEFIDKTNPWHMVFIRLTPNGFRLWFYASHPIKNSHSTIEHFQTSFHFSRKVDVARGIDDVDAMFEGDIAFGIGRNPKSGRGRGSDSDTTLLLLFHPIHHRLTLVDFTDFVRDTSIKKHPLASGSFTSVNV